MNPVSFLSRLEFPIYIIFSFFLIPFSFCPGIVDPGLSLRFILLSVLVAFLAGVQLARRARLPNDQAVEVPPIFVFCCAGYLIVSVVSIIPSINKAEAVFETAKVLLFCLYILLTIGVINRSPGKMRGIAKAIVVSALCISIFGVLEYWGVYRIIDNGWVSPGVTMINRNLLSSYLFLCSGFLLFAVTNYKGLWRTLGLISCAGVLYILLAIQTRAVWLGCIGGALTAFTAVATLRRRSALAFVGREKKLVVAIGVVVLLAIAAVSLFKPAGIQTPSLVQRAASVTDSRFDSNRERLALWRKTVSMIAEHPLAGVGTGNWKIMLPKYGLGDLLCTDMTNIEVRPYNDFLWTAAETGIAGVLFYLVFFVLGIVYAARSLRNARGKTVSLLSVALLYAISGFGIISFFDFPKERIEHLVLFGTVLASAVSTGIEKSGQPAQTRKRNQGLWYTALACACGCLCIGAMRLNGDINDAAMRSFGTNKEWHKAIFAADRASSAFYTVEPTSTPLTWYRGVAEFKLGDSAAAFRDFAKARAFHPWHLNVLNDLGACCNAHKDRKRAIECFSGAVAISPLFEPALVNLAAVYYNAGQYDSAYCIILRCKSPHVDPRFEPFYKAISEKVNIGGCQ